MGVKVRLADNREVEGKQIKAGDVVDVSPGEARRLAALGVAVQVDEAAAPAAAPAAPAVATTAGGTAPATSPAGTVPAGDHDGKAGVARRKG